MVHRTNTKRSRTYVTGFNYSGSENSGTEMLFSKYFVNKMLFSKMKLKQKENHTDMK